ncbi:MAG: YggS family pyridoxal phosphate-dependent enzyme [Anaerolineales bacterium]
MLQEQIRQRYLETLARMEEAARRAGRKPQDVQLIVVTKAQPLEVVRAAIQAGARCLGENYPEEGVMKIQSLPEAKQVEWHMIGHLQRRKADLVIQHFDFFHALDSLRLAQRLSRLAQERGRVLPVLLEFNIGGEESKFGWPAQDEKNWSALWPEIEALLALPGLAVQGLMAMPPLGKTAEDSRPYFRLLRRLRDALTQRFPQVEWKHLSMGTSADYEIAIEEGATMIRVGQAILGPRPQKQE